MSEAKPGDIVRLTVETLGGRGDGVARLEGRPVYVPLAAPGDTADVLIGEKRGDGLAGRLMKLAGPGPARAEPPCPHYGECGGCALQHVSPETYAAWKGGLVGAELARHGFKAGLKDAPVRPMLAPLPGDPSALRRRVALAFHRLDGRVLAGFHARATRRVVPVGRCLLLTGALNRLIAPLAAWMETLLAEDERGQAALTDLGDGTVDLLLASPRAPGPDVLAAAAAFARQEGAARVSWRAHKGRFESAVEGDDDPRAGGDAEPLAQLAPCRVTVAGIAVDFPPGAFLQPCPWGEAALRALAVEGVGKAKRVADLFAGLGTFSLALAGTKGRIIHAYEGDAALARALSSSANRAGFSGKVTATARDLERRPLQPGELAGVDAVVMNPPRAGARAQSRILAQPMPAGPARLVMVSCNPATLARDAAELAAGGWRLEWAAPVDQFLYSPHVEAVALFTRAAGRPRRGGPGRAPAGRI
ncbi:MAG: class I SAM-dependent RNA methyltransferase [Alphaproteobacteria bacterium]|nr:class I SAM-dependent RNA methyltransferase [Alphaproteobacteria bacterium]